MSQRLTRKEIKRDEVLETVGSVFDFVRDHAKALVTGAGGLVVVAALAAAWITWSRGREARANGALGEALVVVEAPIDAVAPDPEGRVPSFASREAREARAEELLARVREEYGGTRAAAIAGTLLAERAAEAGDTERARALWSEFLDRRGDNALAAQVRVNLMEIDRAEGRSGELVERLRAMVDADDRALPRPVVLHQLGLTLEADGRVQEALEVYRRLVDDHPTSPLVAEARERRERLEQRVADG